MSGLRIVTRAPVLAVSLERAKAHLRVDSTDDDELITAMIGAAVHYAEAYMGRALVDTTLDLVLDTFPAGRKPLLLRRPPLIEFLGVFVADSDGDETEIEGIVVDDVAEPARLIAPDSGWPTGTRAASIRIRYRAGYVSYDAEASPPATAGDVPPDIAAAILLYVGSLYQVREDQTPGSMTTVPWSAEMILRQHRVELGMA
jgi:uncharacterized phiE125 gp8 family phage protein